MAVNLPPHTPKRPHHESWHGHDKLDDYHWLKAENWQQVMQDPTLLPADIRAVLDAENAWQEQQMADSMPLQNTLYDELRARIKEDDHSVPAPEGNYLYYSAYITGGQHPRFVRKLKEPGSAEHIYLDGNLLAEGKDYFQFGSVDISPQQTHVAWSFDDRGSEYYEIHTLDITTGQDLADVITGTTGSAVWSADGQGFFYTQQDDHHRPLKSYYHVLGTEQRYDPLIYEEKDTGLFSSVGKTSSERFIVISAHDHDTSENWIVDAQKPLAPPQLIAKREAGIEYEVEHWDDFLIFKTNRDGAYDYKIMMAPLSQPDITKWRDLIPYRPGCFIVSMVVFKNWLVRLERENALPRIVIRHMASGDEHSIAFNEEAYSLGFGEMREYETDVLRFTYSSMTTPHQVFDYDMQKRSRVLRKMQEIPSGHHADEYITRRVMAPASDGAQIPVTLLYKKTTICDGTAPLWLYGYGAYGISLPASFSSNILSLVNRGFIYAIAHIRGGQEKGRHWYQSGKLAQKTNSFHDFISAGQYLVAQNFTSTGQIIAQGGSAGGMLMGAVANMAPSLFKSIIAEVPFVDVLTTMLDDSLPLTPPEWPEWGNPILNAEDYRTIAAYAPYENITAQNYPHILAVSGLTDPRVTYWEPTKWVAKLRELKTDPHLLLLKTNMGAGHGGASGRFDRLREIAFVYSFGLKTSGMLS